ncbi:DsbA family oxidoreductase [Hoeflea prorocentri]|uniref:DsbA family oxidoreductase n=1 Tax=Hoeflea prorocentri TaxID=1922333 RepID=A0A9X3UHJ6_9HYPH|nr:DsbA family oxidoreductase [Hoeflea prorocentri]MCY6380784.1 DsbA family oxidoreductase [Hoeflea prorocentri]MDA5398584.1 DsbA family oxidoreductase [Hoeflea prorocentri]
MTAVNIDIVSDVMCPWCYVGKKRLEAALKELPQNIEVDVRWRPYQLDATLPKEGKDRKEYLSEKFGGSERAKQIYDAILDAGREENIPFDFEAIAVSPNTLDAHRIIRWAASEAPGVQDRLVDILFRAYFLEGKNIGDNTILLEAAEKAGMDRAITEGLLSGTADCLEVEQEIEVARKMGVTGVPCFIIDNKYAVMGAQTADVLSNAIAEVARQKETELASEEQVAEET